MDGSSPAGALDGIRVLDLTTRLAEATGRVLADLGAEVIKIEPPGGCDARFTPPFAEGREDDPDGSLYWQSWGMGKHSVVLDLADPGEREQLRALAGGADILLESFPPGHMESLGLGLDDLRANNEALLVVSVTPYGHGTPDADTPATDLTLAAAGGLLAMQGDTDRPPVPVGFPETSLHGAVQAAADAILALYERNRSGRGQHLDTSMQQCVLWALLFVTGYTAQGIDPPGFGDDRGALGLREVVPGVRLPVVEPCKDGHVGTTFVVGAQGNHGFGEAMRWAEEAGAIDADIAGRDWSAWLTDVGEGTLSAEDAKRGLTQLLAFLETKTKTEIHARAVARKMLIAPAYTTADLLVDPQLNARNFWTEVSGVLHAGPFARLSGTPIAYRRHAPTLGQDQHLAGDARRRPAVPPIRVRSERTTLFDGLKVADVGWIAAGPLISAALANLGATVIRGESEARLDTLRVIPPFLNPEDPINTGHPMANMNQSKLGFACNYSLDAAREIVNRIIDWADVIIENYRPGTAERLGFGWQQVRARRPDVVMLSTCMRGQTGPETDHTGFGLHGACLAGLTAITGWPDRSPQTPWGAYTDFISPRFALAALGAALHHRDRTGEGQYIDLSQVESSIHFISPAVLDYVVNGRVLDRAAMNSERACPHGVFETRGTARFLAIAVETPEQWDALKREVPGLSGTGALGLSERLERKAELEALLAAWCAERDAFEAAQRLRDAGVPAYAVLRAGDLATDPQLVAREHFVELDHGAIGRTIFDGPPTRFSATPARPTHAGPLIGQHTLEVMRDILGYSEQEIAELAAKGALS
ncbi:MAG: CoA transferase [Myxococcota bacterium]|nr:CoA transferase [Myxococcota bacterium]